MRGAEYLERSVETSVLGWGAGVSLRLQATSDIKLLGVGDVAVNAASFNTLHHATGQRIRELLMRPETIEPS